MEDIFNKEENQKNIYVIKHKLAELKHWPNNYDWEWKIGDFRVVIGPCNDDLRAMQKPDPNDSVVKHEKLDVTVYESSKLNPQLSSYVDLRDDSRFKNYQPIQYNVIETPTGGRINLSNGKDMPLIKLCELIRYLHRLSNLTAFL